MKLSSSTLTVLKNFAGINSNIVFNEGCTVKTLAEAKNVMAKANVEDVFPSSFGIYDLNEFLSVISMFHDPELIFADDMSHVKIKEDNRTIKYYFSDPSILTTVTKDITMPSSDLVFTLTQLDFAGLKKAASTLGVEDLIISKVSDNEISLVVKDVKDNTSNSFAVNVTLPTPSTLADFNFIYNISNLKIVPDDYTVTISTKLISHFKSVPRDLQYWIAVEKTSSFEK